MAPGAGLNWKLDAATIIGERKHLYVIFNNSAAGQVFKQYNKNFIRFQKIFHQDSGHLILHTLKFYHKYEHLYIKEELILKKYCSRKVGEAYSNLFSRNSIEFLANA